ncbi:MAG TPA: endonuclease domain-containing protein [Gammaproteobacteria bacterium]
MQSLPQKPRKQQTDAERKLWSALRNRQIKNCKFRRQHKIANYIADFVCLEKQLVIELDGGQHLQQTEYDEERTRFLQSHGFQVLRFWNHQILKNLKQCWNRYTVVFNIQCPDPK